MNKKGFLIITNKASGLGGARPAPQTYNLKYKKGSVTHTIRRSVSPRHTVHPKHKVFH